MALLFAATTDAILVTTLEGEIQLANPAVGPLLGYEPEEMVGHSVGVLTHPQRQPATRELIARVTGGEDIPPYRAPVIRKDGSEVHVSVTISPLVDDAGKPFGAVAVLHDMTYQVAIERQNRLLTAIVHSSTDAVYARDLEGRITFWNPEAARLLGYSEEEALRMDIHRLLPQDALRDYDEVNEKIRQGLQVEAHNTIRMRKNGERVPVSLKIYPIIDENGKPSGAASIARELVQPPETVKAFEAVARLSERETQVLALVAEGKSNSDVAGQLGLSDQTVKNHLSRVLLKLGTTSRTQAAAQYLSVKAFLPTKS